MHENIGAAVLAQTRLSDTCFAPKMMSVPQSLMPHICHWSKQRVIFMFFMCLNVGAWKKRAPTKKMSQLSCDILYFHS